MSNKQSIAFLCHPYHRGGVTRWMADAAIGYAQKGLQVYFVTVEPVKEFFSAKGRETLLQLLSKENSPVHILSAKAGSEFEFGTTEYRAYVYRKLIATLPIGTPIILSDDVAVWEAATSLHRSFPVIGVLHADEDQYYRLAEKYYKEVAALVCVSNRINENTHARVPKFNTEKLHTIPCGINLPEMSYSTAGSNVLQLVYVGRISDYQKRTKDLVGICSLLTAKNMQFYLRIIGDGEAKASLENSFKENGLDEHITFSGWLSQEDVATALAESDMLLLTSDFEGMPIAMMEALAAGCGAAGTRVSGIEDYEYHPLAPDCLVVFSVGDIEDAVNKIQKIAAVPKGIRQQAARKLAEQEFSIDVCLKKYREVIDGIKMVLQVPVVNSLAAHKLLYSNILSFARNIKVGMKQKA